MIPQMFIFKSNVRARSIYPSILIYTREKAREEREEWRARLMKVFAARSNEEEDEGKVDRLVATASPLSAACRDSRVLSELSFKSPREVDSQTRARARLTRHRARMCRFTIYIRASIPLSIYMGSFTQFTLTRAWMIQRGVRYFSSDEDLSAA